MAKANVIRYNEIHGSVGAGVRLGGHFVDGVQYGVENLVYGNIIYENDAGGIKVLVDGQALICGNRFRDNAAGAMTGDFAEKYDGAQPCASAAIGNDLASR